MESKLPPELVFEVLGYLEPKHVSQYMSSSKSTLQSGQEIKKAKVTKLISQMSPKKVEEILNSLTDDHLYWSKAYKELRKQKLIDEIKSLLKDVVDKTIPEKTAIFIKLGNLLIDNQNVFSAIPAFKRDLKTLFKEYYEDQNTVPDRDKLVIEMIFMELYPEDYDEMFGYQINRIF
jgi:hypothetical protein